MPRILVVEDDEDLLSTMMEWLAFNQYEVDGASDGQAALTKMLEGNFDLVILDWQLPSMTGPEVVASYRQSGGASPVLMLTGRRDPQERQACIKAGATDYVSKPFRLEQLSQQILRVLGNVAT